MGLSEGIDEIDALERIKDAKELLDMGAISQKEFDEIKTKYLNEINKSKDNAEILPQKSFNSFINEDEVEYDMVIAMANSIYGNVNFNHEKEKFDYGMRNKIEKTREENERPKRYCPNCGKLVLDNATRCKYCKVMLNKFLLNNSKNINKKVKIKQPIKTKSVLDKNLQERIENNLDKVCDIFDIPNLGKKFVINKLANEYTSEQITEKLNRYDTVPKRLSTVSNKQKNKRKLVDKIDTIPENQLEIFFVISGRTPIPKKEFVDTVQNFWSNDTLKEFYDEYITFLKQGFQEKDFEKVLNYNIEETYRIFSVSKARRMLGEKHAINFIINRCSADEIKEKLDSNFDIHKSYNEYKIYEEDESTMDFLIKSIKEYNKNKE